MPNDLSETDIEERIKRMEDHIFHPPNSRPEETFTGYPASGGAEQVATGTYSLNDSTGGQTMAFITAINDDNDPTRRLLAFVEPVDPADLDGGTSIYEKPPRVEQDGEIFAYMEYQDDGDWVVNIRANGQSAIDVRWTVYEL